MKIHKLRELSLKELNEKLDEKAEELSNIKFQNALHQLDNKAKIRTVRREYATLKTLITEHNRGIRLLKEEKATEELT